MILPIYTYGQPVLRKEAEDIAPDYPELKELVQDSHSLSGRVLCTADEVLVLTFLLENDCTCTASGGVWKQEDNIGTLEISAGENKEIHWHITRD